MAKLRPITTAERADLIKAEALLRDARNLLVRAGAYKAADAARGAIKSAGGALRHSQRRPLVLAEPSADAIREAL